MKEWFVAAGDRRMVVAWPHPVLTDKMIEILRMVRAVLPVPNFPSQNLHWSKLSCFRHKSKFCISYYCSTGVGEPINHADQPSFLIIIKNSASDSCRADKLIIVPLPFNFLVIWYPFASTRHFTIFPLSLIPISIGPDVNSMPIFLIIDELPLIDCAIMVDYSKTLQQVAIVPCAFIRVSVGQCDFAYSFHTEINKLAFIDRFVWDNKLTYQTRFI